MIALIIGFLRAGFRWADSSGIVARSDMVTVLLEERIQN
jgi:hypothetical protein